MVNGERLKERRLELGMSLEDVAKIIHKNKSTIHRYETSEIVDLPVSAIEDLSKALRCSPVYLLGYTDDVYYNYVPFTETELETLGFSKEKIVAFSKEELVAAFSYIQSLFNSKK